MIWRLFKRTQYDDYEEFVPIVDGIGGVLTESPEMLASYRRKIPLMVGTTRDESTLRIGMWANFLKFEDWPICWSIVALSAEETWRNNANHCFTSGRYYYSWCHLIILHFGYRSSVLSVEHNPHNKKENSFHARYWSFVHWTKDY